MKKFISAVVAASLVCGSMGVTAYGSVFADINTVPWSGAATFIDQAQGLGLMNGYNENGKKYCKPKNNVTYCESVQMIYSIMKVYTKKDVSETDVTKWTPVMSAFNIPTWAYNATAYALENKIITNDDLSKLRNGTENAPREDVGVMFGKALAMIYTVNNNASLSYKDNSQISSSAVPYLALLNSKSIMVGDTDNKFNPKAKINRAEMAVLSVKTYNNLMSTSTNTPTVPNAGTMTGTVVNSMILSNGDIFLSVAANNSTGINLFGKKADVKVTYEKETVALSDIGTGDTVTITYDGDTLKSVVITKSKAGIKTAKSYALKELTTSKITVKDGSTTNSFRLADDVTVTLAGKKSSVSSLKSALEDEEFNVILTFDKSDYVTKIEALRNANNPLEGDLTYVSDSKVTIRSGSKEYDYSLHEEDVTVKYDGKTMTFSSLQKNYKTNNYVVTLKLDSKSYVTGITINYMEDETHGTLEFINSHRLELKAQGDTYKYYLADDVDVYIDGKSKKLSDLTDTYEDQPYTVALTVDKYDTVTEISASTKNKSQSKGTLKEITSSKIKITVDSKTYEYTLKDPTIKIDGKTVSASTFRKDYKDYAYTVELTFNSKGEVTGITGKNTKATKGTLKTIEPKKDEITIVAGGVNYTYDLADDVRITLDGSSSTVSKLDKACTDATYNKETITITLTMSKDEVTKVVAETEAGEADSKKGKLISVDEYEISIKEGTKTKTYDFASGNIDLKLDGSTTTFSKLERENNSLYSDEEISVTLTLNSKDEVTKVVAKTVTKGDDEEDEDNKATKGYLTSVTTSSDKFVIKDSKGKKHTWSASDDLRVSYNLSRTYDEDDYADTLKGLKKLLEHCEDEGDDCYISITKTSGGKATRITAEDE